LDDTSLMALIEAWQIASASAKQRIEASDTLFVPTDRVVDAAGRATERLLREAVRRGARDARSLLVAHLLSRGETRSALAIANEENDQAARGPCLLRIARHVDREWSAAAGDGRRRTTREDLLARAAADGAPGAARALAEHLLGAPHPSQDFERARAALADHAMELEQAVAASSLEDEDRARLVEDVGDTLALVEHAYLTTGRAPEEVRAVARRFASASRERESGPGVPHLDPFVHAWLSTFQRDGVLDATALSASARGSGNARLLDAAAVAVIDGTSTARVATGRELAHEATAHGRPGALATFATALARAVRHDRTVPGEILEILRTEAAAGARTGDPDCLVAASRAFRRQGLVDDAQRLLDAARDSGAPDVAREADRVLTDRFAGQLMAMPEEDAPAAVRAHLRLLEACDPDAVGAVYAHALATVTDPSVRAELARNAKLDTIDSVVQSEVSGKRTSTTAVVTMIDDVDGAVRARAAEACNELVVHGLGEGDFALVDSVVAQIERAAAPSADAAPAGGWTGIDEWVEAVRRERVALAPEDSGAVARLLTHVRRRDGEAADEIVAGVLQRCPGTVRRSPELVAAAEQAGLLSREDATEMVRAHAVRTGDVRSLARWFIDHDGLDQPMPPRLARFQRLVGSASVPPPVPEQVSTGCTALPEPDEHPRARARPVEPTIPEREGAVEIEDLPPTTIEITLPLPELLERSPEPEEAGPTLDDF